MPLNQTRTWHKIKCKTKLPSALWHVCTDCNEFRIFRQEIWFQKTKNVNFGGLPNFPLHQSIAQMYKNLHWYGVQSKKIY
jgi:hypothetical protein